MKVEVNGTFKKGTTVYRVLEVNGDTLSLIDQSSPSKVPFKSKLAEMQKNRYEYITAADSVKAKAPNGNSEVSNKAPSSQPAEKMVKLDVEKTVAAMDAAKRGTVSIAHAALAAALAKPTASDDIKPINGRMPEDIPTDLTMPIPVHRAQTSMTLHVTFPNGKSGTLLKGRKGYVYVAHHDQDDTKQCLYFQPDGPASERNPYPVWPQEIELITEKASATKAEPKATTPKAEKKAKPKAAKPKAKAKAKK